MAFLNMKLLTLFAMLSRCRECVCPDGIRYVWRLREHFDIQVCRKRMSGNTSYGLEKWPRPMHFSKVPRNDCSTSLWIWNLHVNIYTFGIHIILLEGYFV